MRKEKERGGRLGPSRVAHMESGHYASFCKGHAGLCMVLHGIAPRPRRRATPWREKRVKSVIHASDVQYFSLLLTNVKKDI